ncbi:serine/threonine-protein kinase [Streptomyces sp. NPDC004296]|uniref:serine/threonine-protein kinase n=1 Tax=Streptomyces sp. NPDC004296 TaxID=3364697 RepID=UPI00369E660E
MTDPFEMGVFALSGDVRRLGPYQLLGQLATGGMGVIYLGRDPRSGRIAAVKTLLAPGGVSAEARKRFDREVRLARRVTSTNTARVLDSDVEAGRPWMAMEYVPAPSLEALVVQQGSLRDERAVRWIGSGVVRALTELHGKGIVHRDVKPLNILLPVDGPKVIDFGISHASDLTSTRLTLGTIAFAAPEQAEGQPSTPASDIYALGITLYYVACGKLPYPETHEPLQQLNYVRRAAISLDGLPAGLTAVIRDCLAVRPDDRPTAEQLNRRFATGTTRLLPPGWTALIGQYAEEGRRLRRAADQAEAETVTRGWTSDLPGRTKLLTQEAQPRAEAPKQASRPEPKKSVPPPKPAGGGKQESKVEWGAVFGAVLVVLGIIWLVQHNVNQSTDTSAGPSTSSATTPSSAARDLSAGTSGGSRSGGAGVGPAPTTYSPSPSPSSYSPSPSPPSAEDIAFGRVATADCLDNYSGTGLDWTPSTPTVTSCAGTDAYYRVTSTERSGSCASADKTWFHSNSDSTDTNLCLKRNYAAGQCMFADAQGRTLSVYRNAVTPCGAGIPAKYQYTVQITKVYPNGAPNDACGSDRLWKPGDGAVYCGKAIWKRHGLPDM